MSSSLNQGAERIAYALGEPLNVVLKRNIKFSILHYRALFIRRDIAANGLSDGFLQKFHVPLQKVDKADTCYFDVGCDILRTVNKIPKPVRLKTDVGLKFVGTGTGKPFSYTEFEEIAYRCANKFTANEPVYTIINDYAYFFNVSKLKWAAFQYIVEDPSKINLCATSDTCYSDDDPFPMPLDFYEGIIKGILSGEFRLLNPKDEQVKVDVEDDK